MHIETVKDFDNALGNGPFAWPGGYPLYFICADGAALSFDAAVENAHLIREAIAEKDNSGWRVVAACINWEDENLICEHTGKQIAPAYD